MADSLRRTFRYIGKEGGQAERQAGIAVLGEDDDADVVIYPLIMVDAWFDSTRPLWLFQRRVGKAV